MREMQKDLPTEGDRVLEFISYVAEPGGERNHCKWGVFFVETRVPSFFSIPFLLKPSISSFRSIFLILLTALKFL